MLNWREQGMWMFCVLMIWHLFYFLTKNEQDCNREGTENTIIYLRKDRRKGWMFSDTCSDWIFLNNYNSLKKKNQKITNSHLRINQWTIVQNKLVIWATERTHQNPHKEAGLFGHQGPCWYLTPILLFFLYCVIQGLSLEPHMGCQNPDTKHSY